MSNSSPAKLYCASCDTHTAHNTTNSRYVPDGNYIRRRRVCRVCGHRHSTAEIPEEDYKPLIGMFELFFRRGVK